MQIIYLLYTIVEQNRLIKPVFHMCYHNGIEIIYINNFKYYYYLIHAYIIVDQKKQAFITAIKANMQ